MYPIVDVSMSKNKQIGLFFFFCFFLENTSVYFSMGDNLDDANNNLRLYLDKVGREKGEHEVNKSRADNTLNPSVRQDFKSIKGFQLYVS